jgi:tight adherence protein B
VQVDATPISVDSLEEAGNDSALPVRTVLLIDISGSMKGQAIAEAADAARAFLAGMRPGDSAAIQAFNESFVSLHSFSEDQASLEESLSGLDPQKETALYDALLNSFASFGQTSEDEARYIVLLSDGGDTASTAPLEEAVAVARSSGAQVYAIGLKSEEFDSQPLASIAEASGGRYLETPDPASLTSLFETLAKEIHNQYSLTFTLPDAESMTGAGKLIVSVAAGGETAQAERGFFYPASATTTTLVATATTAIGEVPAAETTVVANPGVVSRFLDWEYSDYAVGLVVFAIIFALLYMLSAVIFPKRNVLAKYDDLLEHRRELGPRPVEEPTEKTGVAGRAAQRLLAVRGYQHPLQRLIDDAALKFRASEFALLHFVGVVVVVVALRLVGLPLVVVLVAGLLVVGAPLLWLSSKGNSRRKAFDAQVPNTLSILAGALRAGQGFEQAIAIAATEAPEPTASELSRVLAQQRLGVAPEEALREVAERMRSEAFDWVVMTTIIQRQVGGNLAEIFESTANTLRERAKLQRQIKTLTAESRLSAIILIILPFGIAGMIAVVNRGYLRPLYENSLGLAMLGVSFALLIVGILWMRKIARLDT